MSKVLYIKANIKSEGESRTFQVSDHFIEEYKRSHPEDQVEVVDLYKEGIDFLRQEDLGAIFGPKNEESRNHPKLKYAYQFAEADKYVIAAPMWNLGSPAILKAYFDYVSVTGIAFKYTAEGPVGLLTGKKAVHIVARGGEYANAPYEMGDRYIKTILGFFGVADVETIAVENVDVIGVNVPEKVDAAKENASALAKQF